MSESIVSVILPVYNRSTTLPRAINSVLAQTYENFELIIVDDGSDEDIKKIVEKFQKNDDRIIFIRHEKNLGANAARNTGMKESKGHFLAFQDSDDEWMPNKLQKQVELIEDKEYNFDAVYCGYIKINPDGTRAYYPQILPNTNNKFEGHLYEQLLRYNFIGLPTLLVRKHKIENQYFDENLPRLQDWDFNLRISKKCKFGFIPEPLVKSYVGKDSISSNADAFIEALEILKKKHYQHLNKEIRNEIMSRYYFLLGYALFLNNDIEKSKERLLKSLKYKPINISSIGLLFSIQFFRPKITKHLITKYQQFNMKLFQFLKSSHITINN